MALCDWPTHHQPGQPFHLQTASWSSLVWEGIISPNLRNLAPVYQSSCLHIFHWTRSMMSQESFSPSSVTHPFVFSHVINISKSLVDGIVA
ncbi:hypothetical protein CEXT_771781 [Caerostris extrusa]|uniref:Uncharacterized protein n=1 Tax=Caerostris extrusa TaxID=172846 RepID=A0AAV4YFT5_CAEEX|nr:hypothetical protein CEXT_771781 [Caerostris extrusa]